MTVSSSPSVSPGLARLNGMTLADARRALLTCCGSTAWADAVSRQLPVRTEAELYSLADRVWSSLCAPDWLEAFRAHPRIGARSAVESQGDAEQAARWSADEQAVADRGSPDVRATLAEVNGEYESRFGHIFLICASGRSAEEILREMKARLGNSADQELAVAAEEQRRIMRLRLTRVIAP